jgi:hypothetical protein
MIKIKITRNPFILFSPFLFLYLVFVFKFPTNGTMGDENRYLMFAQHLLNGFYSWPAPNIDIGDGPGYPILIMPFVALKTPLIFITSLNALLYYFSIIFLFKSLQQVTSFSFTLIACLFWAAFYNSYQNLSLILPEVFTTFLVSLLIFYLLRAFKVDNTQSKKRYIYISGFILGYIALTKIIFGYVLLFTLVIIIVACLWKIKNINYKKMAAILLTALATTAPFLVYTFHMTGKLFFWGTTGGENLYWMSTPYEGEYGDWFQFPIDPVIKDNNLPETEVHLTLNHKKDFDEILNYKGIQRDDAYKRIAIKNIKSNPGKFFKNCISNVGRMFFNYPYSYTAQKNSTLARIFFNGIILVIGLFCLIPTFLNWRKIIFPIKFLLLFAAVYFGGSILASAETRMFTIIIPVLLLWIAYIIHKTHIDTKWAN